jgi:hypothetical protein
MLGLLVCYEEEVIRNNKAIWQRRYRLADDVSIDPLA